MTFINCPKCGRQLNANTVICPNCGHEFVKLKKDNKKTLTVIIAVASIVVVGLIIFGAVKYIEMMGDAAEKTGEYTSKAIEQVDESRLNVADSAVRSCYTAYSTSVSDLEVTGDAITEQSLKASASGKVGSTLISQSSIELSGEQIVSVSWCDGEYWAKLTASTGQVEHGTGSVIGQNVVS